MSLCARRPVAAAYYITHASAELANELRTVTIKRGDLLSTISATGTVEPEEVVDVGAQVAGLILEFGPDPHDPAKLIDYGSVVEKGTVLAKIDPTPYEAALEQAEATLERSQADLLQLDAKYEQTNRSGSGPKVCCPREAIADTDYDTALAKYKSAKANVAVGKATIRQNKAALRTAKTNLGYTTITSPVRGVIIDRRVNIGQTVVASLNAPSLFLIAKDLRRMQVWASVNEADIGRIQWTCPCASRSMPIRGQTFRGKVTQIRMNATMTQNVVTYTVIVTTDNSDGKLAAVPDGERAVRVGPAVRSVLLVPNAALRWKPRGRANRPGGEQDVRRRRRIRQAIAENRGWLWVAAGAAWSSPWT